MLRTRSPITLSSLALTLALACGDDGGSSDAGASSTGVEASSGSTDSPASGSTTGEDDASGATGGDSSDGMGDSTGTSPGSAYPPCGAGNSCPEGSECANFDGTGSLCMPPCVGEGPSGVCPEPETGTASGFCGVNSNSSQQACTMKNSADECMAEGETCVSSGAGPACLLPGSHCILFCGVPLGDCPDGMECSASGLCEWSG